MRSYNYILKFNTFFFKGLYGYLRLVIINCLKQFISFLSHRLYKLLIIKHCTRYSFFSGFLFWCFYLKRLFFFKNISFRFSNLKHFSFYCFFHFFSVDFNRSFFSCNRSAVAAKYFFSDFVGASFFLFSLKKTFYGSFIRFIGLPVKIKKFVFLKSPHVHKKAREHLEIRWNRVNVFFSAFFILFDFSKYLPLYGSNFSLFVERLEHDLKVL